MVFRTSGFDVLIQLERDRSFVAAFDLLDGFLALGNEAVAFANGRAHLVERLDAELLHIVQGLDRILHRLGETRIGKLRGGSQLVDLDALRLQEVRVERNGPVANFVERLNFVQDNLLIGERLGGSDADQERRIRHAFAAIHATHQLLVVFHEHLKHEDALLVNDQLLLEVGDPLPQRKQKLGIDILRFVALLIHTRDFRREVLVNELARNDEVLQPFGLGPHHHLFALEGVNVPQQFLLARLDGVEERFNHLARTFELGEVAVERGAEAGNDAEHPSRPSCLEVKPGRVNFVELNLEVRERIRNPLTFAAADLAEALQRLLQELVRRGSLADNVLTDSLDGGLPLFFLFGIADFDLEQLANEIVGLAHELGVGTLNSGGFRHLIRSDEAKVREFGNRGHRRTVLGQRCLLLSKEAEVLGRRRILHRRLSKQ